MKFSANLGFLWTELALPDAVRAAKAAGFAAVECHWPYDVPAADFGAALQETGLPMLSLNTRRGDVAAGENGLCAVPGREGAAQAAIYEAITYGALVGARHVHVMAGKASGPDAHKCFVDNLGYACSKAAEHGLGVLIEPLNTHDAPGYFLRSTDQACAIIAEVGQPNLKLMFDCYHVQLIEGDLTNRLTRLLPHLGHVQFAGVPARGRPDEGEVSYPHIFRHLASLGVVGPYGAEYKPGGPTEPTLGWLEDWSGRLP